MFVVFFSDSSNSSWDLILGYKHELIMRLIHHILFEKKQKNQNKTKENRTKQVSKTVFELMSRQNSTALLYAFQYQRI